MRTLVLSLVLSLSLLSVPAEARMLNFSGFSWYVRNSAAASAPGPNYFSDSTKNVWVDSQGRLHLRITKGRGRWYCAEVFASASIGYGTYRFYVDSPVGTFDPNVVVGLFTWNDDPAFNHREMDVEFSRWGHAANANAQFVVQPYTDPKQILRFEQPADMQSTHTFVWQPNAVDFTSLRGLRATSSDPSDVIQQWSDYSGIPIPGGEHPHINFWLANGQAPLNGAEAEVIINRVEFVPLP